MKKISLTLQEFLNFKKIYKGKFESSKIINNQIFIVANEAQLNYLGY
jgi:hypothetical protein